MQRLVSTVCFIALLSLALHAGVSKADVIDRDWYAEHYDFFVIIDTFFTYETEFVIPEGFGRPDSASLTPFQYWISHFPIWNWGKSVGSWGGGRVAGPDSVLRVVHLPWNNQHFRTYTIPLRIQADYLRYRKREFDLVIIPTKGDTITYERFLRSSHSYNNVGRLVSKDSPPRDTSMVEYYKFLRLGMRNVDFATMAQNCDSISPQDLAPGDLFIGHDETGKTGFVYMIMNMFVNDEGDKIYSVASGCKKGACDYYMPLVNEEENDPWLTIDELKNFAPDFPHEGFFRLRIK